MVKVWLQLFLKRYPWIIPFKLHVKSLEWSKHSPTSFKFSQAQVYQLMTIRNATPVFFFHFQDDFIVVPNRRAEHEVIAKHCIVISKSIRCK